MLGCRCMLGSGSAAKINRCHAFSFMPEFSADSEPCFDVLDFLCRHQGVCFRATDGRAFPTGQFLVSLLRIGMSKSVEFR